VKAADVAAPVLAKKVAKPTATEEELQAEIASLSHLSSESGEVETPEERAMKDDAAERKAAGIKEVKAVKVAKVVKEVKEVKAQVPTVKTESAFDVSKLRKTIFANQNFQQKVEASCAHKREANCAAETSEVFFCQLLKRSKPAVAKEICSGAAASFVQVARTQLRRKAPEDELAKEMTHDLEMNFNKIAPFGKEDTAKELQDHAAKTQDTLVDAVENAEVAEIKRAVFRALTRLRAATIKEFDTIARLETQAIDAYNDAHHYRAENPLAHLHEDEAPVETDKLKSFH